MPSITSNGPSTLVLLRKLLAVAEEDASTQADVLERIQQQLASINDNNNLEAGERLFD